MDTKNIVLCLLATAMILMSPASLRAQMIVESFNGMPTQNEINSFKSFIQSVSPGTGGNLNPANNWAQHKSGQNTKAMGLIYEITGDLSILDRMIEFCDVLLSTRNDLAPSPVGQHVIWTGQIEPVWPNKSVQPIGTGGEQGDPVGHLAYCARLILQTPSIWNTAVGIGDPKGYGNTYLARATRFVQEADYTMDSHILSDLLDLTNQNRMYWKSGNPYMTGTVPWNQQVMFTYAFQNLAAAHSILNDDPASVSLYDAIVSACMDWFFSGEPGTAQPYTNSNGNIAYLWSYRPPTGREDWSHSNLDIQGIYRAYNAGKYGVTDAKMLPLANTFMDVIRRGPNDYAGRVDGTDGSGNSSPTNYVRPGWYVAALFRPADYNTIVSDDLTVGGATGDVTRFSYFLWIKHKRNAPATLYQGCNYGGWSASFSTGSYTLSDMQARGIKNDNASSIKIKSGYTATLYSGDNFTGSSIVLSGNDVCFTDNNFNDMASSMKIYTNGATLYQNCAYDSGYSGTFDSGSYTLSDLIARGICNDDVSSIKVISGYVVTLYEHDNFGGASVTLTSDNSCLSSLGWNDRVSSMTVVRPNLATAEVTGTNEFGTKYTLNSYPNPAAAGKVNILYTVREPGHVKITVYTLSGTALAPLVDEHKHTGTFNVTWDASDTPKGIYVVKMLSGGHNLKTTKVVLKE